MPQNVMTGFMQGYQWADDMQRRQLQDERQEKLDQQAQQDRTRRIGMEDEVMGRQRKEWNDKDAAARLSEIAYKIDTGGYEALTDEDREVAGNLADPLTKKTLERLGKTPDDAKAALGHIDNVFSAMSGQGGDYRGAIDSANVLLADYINQGQGGTEKRIKDVLPAQSGRGFYLDLEMKDEKGNYKTAPMTRGRGTADTDPVSEVDGAEMMQALGLLKKSIEARLVALGDNSPLERQKEKREAAAELAKEERKYQHERDLQDLKALGDWKTIGGAKEGHYAINFATGMQRRLIPGLGYSGGSDSGEEGDGYGASGRRSGGGRRLKVTKEDQSVFDDQLRKQFIAEYMDGVKSLPEDQRSAYADVMETDELGNARVDMDRVFAKMPPEMRERFNAARQAGEMFMGDGSLSPVLAANQAYANTIIKPEVKKHPLAEVDPKDKAQVDEAMQMISKMTMEDLDASLQELSDPNNPVFNPGLVKEINARLSKKQAERQAPPPRTMAPQANVFPYQPGASTKTKASFSFDNPFKSDSSGDVAFAEKQIATLAQQLESGRLSGAAVADAKQKLAWWQGRLTKLSR